MRIFSLRGHGGAEISMELTEPVGFPDDPSIEGGYEILCRLTLRAGSCRVLCERYVSATGALYRFADALERCYNELGGRAEYGLVFEDGDLAFMVAMTSRGRAEVSGDFSEPETGRNRLHFSFDTDQSFFPPVIRGINGLKTVYGGYNGIFGGP